MNRKVIATLLVVGTVGVVLYRKASEDRPPVLSEEAAWDMIARELFRRPGTRDWTALRWHRDRKGEHPARGGWEYRLEHLGAGIDRQVDVQVGQPFELEGIAGDFVLVARPAPLFDYLWERVTGQ
jgi:hypothetical protein